MRKTLCPRRRQRRGLRWGLRRRRPGWLGSSSRWPAAQPRRPCRSRHRPKRASRRPPAPPGPRRRSGRPWRRPGVGRTGSGAARTTGRPDRRPCPSPARRPGRRRRRTAPQPLRMRPRGPGSAMSSRRRLWPASGVPYERGARFAQERSSFRSNRRANCRIRAQFIEITTECRRAPARPLAAARRILPGPWRLAPGAGELAPLLRRLVARHGGRKAEPMEINELARLQVSPSGGLRRFLPTGPSFLAGRGALRP